MKELRGKNFWITLIVGSILFTFVNGVYNVDIIALIAPVLFLMITRNTSKVSDFLLIALGLGIGGIIKYPNSIFMGFPYDQINAFAITTLLIIPFIIDKFIYKNFAKDGSTIRKFVATFIFPTNFAILEEFLDYASAGTTISMSVTQNDILPFMQIASVVGQFGFAFLITWVPAFIYFLIDAIMNMERKSLMSFIKEIKVPVAIFTIVFVAIFTFGELRLTLKPVTEPYVKVAYAHGVIQKQDAEGQRLMDPIDTLNKALSTQIKTAAQNDAKLVCFHEEAFYIANKDYDNFVKLISKECKENEIYSLVGIEVEKGGDEELSRNVAVLADPEGKILYEYDKSRLIPIMETGSYEVGDKTVPVEVLELSPGVPSVVSSAICFEGEFSSYINQVGPETDIHLNPSFEWIDNSEFHAKALQLRAIEHGMSVVEPTIRNPGTIFDCLGRVVATSSTLETGYDSVTFGDIPAQGVYTIYILGGFVLDYLYMFGLTVFIVLAIVRRNALNMNKKENKKGK